MQDNCVKRLTKLEKESGIGIFDSITTSEKKLSKTKKIIDMDEIQPKSYENEDQNHNNLTEGNDEMIKNQQFNSSWQNVRINRRLQTIEDGMEQLFTMLDTLGTEQNKFDEKLSGGRKDGLDMEELNKLEARLRAKLEESGPKDIGDDDIRLKIANLEKQIKKVEDNT